MALFERGFKTWCEKASLDLRRDVGALAHDPIDARALAKSLGIAVCGAGDFKTLPARSRAALAQPDAGWSAITLELPEGRKKLVILNDTHSAARQSSDLTHELAHHLCGHTPSSLEVSKEGLMMLESYSRKHEEEADWLAGALLLPRPALLHIKKRITDERFAAAQYNVSIAMLKYRLDVTGVNYQFRRAGAAQTPNF